MATHSAALTANGLEEVAKPFLRRVWIRNFKSIAFCDVELSPLTALVGRNAAGKSNFLDALAFLVDLMDGRATKAVNARGGWESIRSRTRDFHRVEFGLSTAFASYESSWEADYSFRLEPAKNGQVRVESEELSLIDGHGRRCGFRVSDGESEWWGQDLFEGDANWATRKNGPRHGGGDRFPAPTFVGGRGGDPDRLLLSVIGSQPFLDLSAGLRASGVYNFHPPAMRQHQPTSASPVLARDGSNLARAIEGLREIEPQTLERINAYLTAMVPEIERFKRVKRGDLETIRFWLTPTKGRKPVQLDASSMSDGTLRLLGTLVAAFQIVLPTGFPGFVAIEEPETALHPAALRALVDALSEATARTQILISTHSADLLDNPTIESENVRVVETINGQTAITKVDNATVDIVRRKLNTLGGLERDNLLEANVEDLNRQRKLERSLQASRK
jgi:predicted ATPase